MPGRAAVTGWPPRPGRVFTAHPDRVSRDAPRPGRCFGLAGTWPIGDPSGANAQARSAAGHCCRSLAAAVPEICQKLRYTQPHAAPPPSPQQGPLTCADVWGREVPHGDVNLRRIDGKDGVAGSIPAGGSTKPMTSANADHGCVGEAYGRPESTSLVGMRSDWTGRPQALTIPLTSVIASLFRVPICVAGCIAAQQRIPGRRARVVCVAARAAQPDLPCEDLRDEAASI
jgi:hypothetical protein